MADPAQLDHDVAGEGLTVVLIHGHPFARSMWAPQVAALAPSFRVVTPDLRGYGGSAAVAGRVTMGELADDVWALLDALRCERVAVVGLSMGGLIAMEMAIGRPDRVWALGLLATTADPVTDAERETRRARAAEVDRVGIQPVLDDMVPHLFGPGADPQTVDRVHAMMRSTSPAGAAAALRGRAERPDYRPGLRRLDVPTLVCVGTDDHWSTRDVTDRLVAALPSPQVVTLDGAGHLPNLERPDEVNAMLLEFLTAAGAR